MRSAVLFNVKEVMKDFNGGYLIGTSHLSTSIKQLVQKLWMNGLFIGYLATHLEASRLHLLRTFDVQIKLAQDSFLYEQRDHLTF